METSFLKNVRAMWSLPAENASIPALYTPHWVEPALDMRFETRVNGKLRHDMEWAASTAVRVPSRVVSIPGGVVISAALWAATAVAGTAAGLVGGAVSGLKNLFTHERPEKLAVKRGFVKGYAVTSASLGVAAAVVSLPVLVAAATVGLAAGVFCVVPVRAAGAILDR